MPLPVALILPALDEEEAIGPTLTGFSRHHLDQIIVVDNGSTDRTAAIARAHGADVVAEPRRGYGRACLAGIATLRPEIAIVAFADADGSDDPGALAALLEPIQNGAADLVIGSRELGEREAGALAPQQRAGNRLATFLLRCLYGGRHTDLGPFRCIRRASLLQLGMRDHNFGWTIEMQIKARRRSLRVREIAVRSRRRLAGRSKVSGTFAGSIQAGAKILWTLVRYRLTRS